jgi:hypothetical protein
MRYMGVKSLSRPPATRQSAARAKLSAVFLVPAGASLKVSRRPARPWAIVRLDVPELTSQRPVPGEGIGTVREILVVEHLKARVVNGSDTLRDLAHVGNTITLLDTQSNLTVAEVVVVVLVSHEPLVHTEDTAGLKNSEDLAVDALESGSVHGSLDSINGIETVVGERHLLTTELACIWDTEVTGNY